MDKLNAIVVDLFIYTFQGMGSDSAHYTRTLSMELIII